MLVEQASALWYSVPMKLWKYVLAVLVGMALGILAILLWLDYREDRAFHGNYGASWESRLFDQIYFPEGDPSRALSLGGFHA